MMSRSSKSDNWRIKDTEPFVSTESTSQERKPLLNSDMKEKYTGTFHGPKNDEPSLKAISEGRRLYLGQLDIN
jgi:hypothetical protein